MSQDIFELSNITTKPHSFKASTRIKSTNKRFKPARQLISDEIKYLQTKNLKFDTPTMTSLTAPPTLKPLKKYCDITGLEGRYRSPSNNLRYHNMEIFQEVIKHMPPSFDQEYLSLRGANVILK